MSERLRTGRLMVYGEAEHASLDPESLGPSLPEIQSCAYGTEVVCGTSG